MVSNAAPLLAGDQQHQQKQRRPSARDRRASSRAAWLLSGAGDESLASHHLVNPMYRYGVPLAIILNVALFISSNTGIGADLRVRIEYPGSTTWMSDLFEFSLGGTIRDMWTAGVYSLGIFIGTFSGGWPYLKLLLMWVSWIVPRRWLSRKWRERWLMMLNAFGKWSLIDAFVMVMMMVAFRFNIAMPPPNELPANTYNSTMTYPEWSNASYTNASAPYVPAAVDVFVQPDWGIYGFVAATIASLIITHVILHVHRAVAKPPSLLALEQAEARAHAKLAVASSSAPASSTINSPQLTEEKLALCNFVRKERGKRIGLSALGKYSIVALLIGSAVLMSVGASVQSFAFEFAGAISLVLTKTKSNYSLLSLGWNLPNSSNTPDAFGIRFLQSTYLLFAFVVPLSHVIVLTVLWFVPLTLRAQGKMLATVETLNAWSALEVFVLSLIASMLQIRQFAAFMVGDACGSLSPLLNLLSPLLNGDDKCFDVIATLDDGCWIMFAAVLEYMLARYVVMKLCHDTHGRRQQDHIKRFEKVLSGVEDDESGEDESSDDDDDANWWQRTMKKLRSPFIIEMKRRLGRHENSTSSLRSESESSRSPSQSQTSRRPSLSKSASATDVTNENSQAQEALSPATSSNQMQINMPV